MKLHAIGITSILLSLCFSAAAHAKVQFLNKDDPAGKEIREVAHEFCTRISQADAAGSKALFAGPPEDAAILDAQIIAVEAWNKFFKVVVTRIDMTKEPEFRPEELKPFRPKAADMLIRPIILSGDRASVAALQSPDGGLELQKINGAWKVIHLTVHYRDASATATYFRNLADLCDTVRAGMESGKLRTAKEIDDALIVPAEELLDRLLEENHAPVPGAKPIEPATAAQVPRADELAKLVGKQWGSREVQGLFLSLPGLPKLVILRGEFFVLSFESGISLSLDKSDLTLQGIELYGPGDAEYCAYPGVLPQGLAFGETRRKVEHDIGRPTNIGEDWVSYERLGLYLTCARKSGKDPANPLVKVTLITPKPGAPLPATQPAHAGPRLAFRLVVPENSPQAAQAERLHDPDEPAGKSTLLVSRAVALDESAINNVDRIVPLTPRDRQKISFEFTAQGARKMAAISAAHAGERLALVEDGRVIIVATINANLADKIIIGNFKPSTTDDDVSEMVRQLRYIVYSLPD